MTYSKNSADRSDSEQIQPILPIESGLNHRRSRSWLWLLFTGSSIAAHLILIQWLNTATLSQPQGGLRAAMPIDFVELPSGRATQAKASQPIATTVPSSALANSDNPAAKTSKTAVKTRPNITDSSISVTSDAEVDAAVSSNVVEAPASPEPESTLRHAPPASTATPHFDQSAAAHQPEASSTSEVSDQPLSTAETPSLPSPSTLETPNPASTIITQAIEVPLPDVSGRLPASSSQASPTVANQIMVPSQLVASVMAVPLPSADSKSSLDEIAYPQTETQTFASNAKTSPCRVTPEAVQFLGQTVEMEVTTDAAGQVVDATTQASSQNQDYDNLATCLIKNWQFAPVIAREETTEPDALIVRITIDRS